MLICNCKPINNSTRELWPPSSVISTHNAMQDKPTFQNKPSVHTEQPPHAIVNPEACSFMHPNVVGNGMETSGTIMTCTVSCCAKSRASRLNEDPNHVKPQKKNKKTKVHKTRWSWSCVINLIKYHHPPFLTSPSFSLMNFTSTHTQQEKLGELLVVDMQKYQGAMVLFHVNCQQLANFFLQQLAISNLIHNIVLLQKMVSTLPES